ncbi:MAG: hypothetical protein GTO03_00705 [Planctomycetales bacterium]|nr:hypothetical protein [Planctomycetales bacterium]
MPPSKSEVYSFYRLSATPRRSRLTRFAAGAGQRSVKAKSRGDRRWQSRPAGPVAATREAPRQDDSITADNAPPPVHTKAGPPWCDVLQLWLQWHEAHSELIAHMYQVDNNTEVVEELLDETEQLRLEAVKRSEQLLA